MRGFFRVRKNSGRTCHCEAKCHKALWLQAREELWSNCMRTRSSKSTFFLCKKYELLLRSLRSHQEVVMRASWVLDQFVLSRPVPCCFVGNGLALGQVIFFVFGSGLCAVIFLWFPLLRSQIICAGKSVSLINGLGKVGKFSSFAVFFCSNDVQPFHSQEWSISNFPCSLTTNMISDSVTNLAFHSYTDERWLYYQFSLPHSYNFSSEGRENELFELESKKV